MPVKPGRSLSQTHPQLVSQALMPDLAAACSAGSQVRLAWKCAHDAHPSWEATVASRVRGAGCPYCSGRRPVPGVDDLATTHPDLAASLVDPTRAALVKAGSATQERWRCLVEPTHPEWTAQVRKRVAAVVGCPTCAGRSARTPSPLLPQAHPSLIDQAVDPNALHDVTSGSGRVVQWRCVDCVQPHTYSMPVRKRVAGQGCPVAAGRVVVPGINSLDDTHPEIAAQLKHPEHATSTSRGAQIVHEWVCANGHEWCSPVYARVAGNGCPQCSQVGRSKAEVEIADIMRRLRPDADVETHVTGLLDGRHELDIVCTIPGRNNLFAIEYNGILWHSEKYKTQPSYHRDKTIAARRSSVDLVHVWEDEWTHRRSQIIRALAHRTDSTDRLAHVVHDEFDTRMTEKVMARTMTISMITGKTARAFMLDHHVQGPITATMHLALVDRNGTPRAVMSLRSPANSARARRDAGDWEIARYATFGIVPGGFTRLLAHAPDLLTAHGHTVSRWISFSDDALSDGGMYRAAGFVCDRVQSPDYKYAGTSTQWRREPKEKYQRKYFRNHLDLQWDETWTEHEAALANGLYRVYDAGKTRWVKTL